MHINYSSSVLCAVVLEAHQLVNAYPTAAVSWFCAGCYYYMIKKYEHARRFFSKSTVCPV